MSEPSESSIARAVRASVVIIDTSVLIALKTLVQINRQLEFFAVMSRLVEEGLLAFPRQVGRELSHAKFPDMPGAWAAGTKGHLRHREPDDASVAEVLGVAQLVDADAESEAEGADSYVAAMAWEISETSHVNVGVVATEDRVDRMPVKESLTTACKRLDVECWDATKFVAWVWQHAPRQ